MQERAQAVSGWGHGYLDTWIRDEKGQNFRESCICLIRAKLFRKQHLLPESPGCSLGVGLVSKHISLL